MSGGHYDVSLPTDAEFLMDHSHRNMEALAKIAADLAALGYAEDAATETEELVLIMRQFSVRMNARINRLYGVWKAIDYWKSCDWSEDSIKAALAKYREQAGEKAS